MALIPPRKRRHGRRLRPAPVVLGALACVPVADTARPQEGPGPPGVPRPEGESVHDRRRARMVTEHLQGRGITDRRVLEVMGRVPRHLFVPPALAAAAYDDSPLPIGEGQTISQPYIVALMTELAAPRPTDRALDVGTGSGYQAAVLAGLVRDVSSIEIVPTLAAQARSRLARLGYRNVQVRLGDGSRGWPERAPFDIILVAAAPAEVPRPLRDQLKVGGRLVLPVGGPYLQDLVVLTKRPDGTFARRTVAPVAFVPMTGEALKAAQPRP